MDVAEHGFTKFAVRYAVIQKIHDNKLPERSERISERSSYQY
jgi:hypothetical protein